MLKTTDDFKKAVFELVGDEYNVIGEYVKAKVKIKIKHNSCGEEFEITPDNFKSGQRCRHCFGNKRKTQKQFEEEVFELVGDEYLVVGKYVNNRSKIEMIHNKCGKLFSINAKSFLLSGRRCTHCKEKQKEMGRRYAKTTDVFKKEVKDIVGKDYEVIGEYHSTHTKIDMRHNVCGNIYDVSPANFLSGKRCPNCASSNGEKAVELWLIDNQINYKSQYSFEDLKYKKTLFFDFAIFDNSGNIMCLIEFDGIQHFKTIEGWGGKGKLEDTIARDNVKNKYCKAKGIDLLRISYLEINEVDSILNNKIGELYDDESTREETYSQGGKLEQIG